MKTDIQILQDVITPEVLGVFWITNETFISRPRPLSALDYFLDGLLHSYGEAQKKNSSPNNSNNFFISQSFGVNFFVGHLCGNTDDLNKYMNDIVLKSTTAKAKQRKILVIDFTEENNIENLKKNYSDFDFEKINFD